MSSIQQSTGNFHIDLIHLEELTYVSIIAGHHGQRQHVHHDGQTIDNNQHLPIVLLPAYTPVHAHTSRWISPLLTLFAFDDVRRNGREIIEMQKARDAAARGTAVQGHTHHGMSTQPIIFIV